jgi:hypothetical protein
MNEHDGVVTDKKALVPTPRELTPVAQELEVKELVERAIEGVQDVLFMIEEEEFFPVGSEYGFEQLVGVDMWEAMEETTKKGVLAGLGMYLGVDSLDIPKSDFTKFEPGVPGTRSEGGADVAELPTNIDGLKIRVSRYRDQESKLGTRYGLVCGPTSSE